MSGIQRKTQNDSKMKNDGSLLEPFEINGSDELRKNTGHLFLYPVIFVLGGGGYLIYSIFQFKNIFILLGVSFLVFTYSEKRLGVVLHSKLASLLWQDPSTFERDNPNKFKRHLALHYLIGCLFIIVGLLFHFEIIN